MPTTEHDEKAVSKSGEPSLVMDFELQVGKTWKHWSGGYVGRVFWSGFDRHGLEFQLSFPCVPSTGLVAFGFEVMPERYRRERVTATLSRDYPPALRQLSREVDGAGDAQFFGFLAPIAWDHLRIEDESGGSLAVGNFVTTTERDDVCAR